MKIFALFLIFPLLVYGEVFLLKKSFLLEVSKKNIAHIFFKDQHQPDTHKKNIPYVLNRSVDFKDLLYSFNDTVHMNNGIFYIMNHSKIEMPEGFLTGFEPFIISNEKIDAEPGFYIESNEHQTSVKVAGALTTSCWESFLTYVLIEHNGFFYVGKHTPEQKCGEAYLDGNILFNKSTLAAQKITTSQNTNIVFYCTNKLLSSQKSIFEGNYSFLTNTRIYATDVSLNQNNSQLECENITFKNAILHLDIVFDDKGFLSFPTIHNVDIEENVTIELCFLQSYKNDIEERKKAFQKFIHALSGINVNIIKLKSRNCRTIPQLTFVTKEDHKPEGNIIEELKKKGITLTLVHKTNGSSMISLKSVKNKKAST